METVKLELSHADCELFKKFQERYEDFKILDQAGVFTLRGANAIISFTPEGDIGSIQIQPFTYRRKVTTV